MLKKIFGKKEPTKASTYQPPPHVYIDFKDAEGAEYMIPDPRSASVSFVTFPEDYFNPENWNSSHYAPTARGGPLFQAFADGHAAAEALAEQLSTLNSLEEQRAQQLKSGYVTASDLNWDPPRVYTGADSDATVRPSSSPVQVAPVHEFVRPESDEEAHALTLRTLARLMVEGVDESDWTEFGDLAEAEYDDLAGQIVDASMKLIDEYGEIESDDLAGEAVNEAMDASDEAGEV